MNKTTEALKLAEEALSFYVEDFDCAAADVIALAAIREALAESKPAPDGRIPKTVFTLDDISKAAEMGRQAGMIDALAEPVKHESVMDYEHICALREGEQHQAEDSYFFVRPENDTPTSRKMFCQGFERGFHKGLKYAAQVSAKREWVDLTDDEIDSVLRSYTKTDRYKDDLRSYRAVIAAFKEKNK